MSKDANFDIENCFREQSLVSSNIINFRFLFNFKVQCSTLYIYKNITVFSHVFYN